MSRKYRMYGLVPYNLSPIQQGIQFGHAVVEYGLKHNDKGFYNNWAEKDKTFIILNGGTTNSRRFDGKYVGTLNQYSKILSERGILTAEFYEPDLGDQLTAVVFIVDDRVWDKEKFPDYDGPWLTTGSYNNPVKKPIEISYNHWVKKFDAKDEELDNIFFLRDWLKQFKLA